MSVNSNKRKGRANANTKLGRSRGLGEKNISVDGVYGNSRLMAAVSSLVGCIVQVQVQNGTQFEGIFKTFSRQFDLVLEMPHKIDQKSIPAIGLGPAVSSLLVSFPIQDGLSEKLIFQLKDVVMVKASDVDLDYAIKDNFTDTSISKFNGQIAEKELEPWEGPPSDSDNLANLGVEDDDGANGWDANDMFKTNAEKYGVVSSYDNALLGYTVPLEKKNTEEYKLQEAKALRIAQEIESNTQYQSHIQLENGDEEDRFSAVVRPENINSNRYVPPQRRRSVPGSKRPVTAISSSPNRAMGSKLYSSQADTAATVTSTHSYNTTQLPTTTGSLRHTLNPPTLQVASPALSPLPVPQTVLSSDGTEKFVNGEAEDEARSISATSSEHVPLVADIKLIVQSSIVPEPLPPRPERRREIDRKCLKKGRDNEIEEFKKFSSNFKLSEEKEPKEHNNEGLTVDLNHDQSVLTAKIPDLKVSDSVNSEVVGEEEKPVTNVKTSTLNPNAKEFVFNPNAKSFTPQSLGAPNLHASLSLQPHRMHTQSPVMAMPPAQVVQGIAQPVFTAMAHQYVMQAAPVSVSLTSPFATASLSQAPRFRKVPITLQPRHDMSPSMHVAAATGQPILAPSAIPTPSQLTMQYNPPPGMIHASGPPQQTMAYPQMYSVVGPRVMPPQSVGVVPTSHAASYCEAPHIPAHLFMSAHHNAAHQIQQGISGQHSNPHQSQSHAPVIHPSPSPIHQGPPHVNHSQAPPTTVMYHGSMSQHSLQTGHHNPNPSQNHHVNHPHHSSFVGGPQPMVLMSQQGIHGSHNHHPNSLASTPVPLQLHSIHGQNTGSHVGTPTHVLPQMTVIPTSAAMVSAPTAMATTQYIPHPQGTCTGPVKSRIWSGPHHSSIFKNCLGIQQHTEETQVGIFLNKGL